MVQESTKTNCELCRYSRKTPQWANNQLKQIVQVRTSSKRSSIVVQESTKNIVSVSTIVKEAPQSSRNQLK